MTDAEIQYIIERVIDNAKDSVEDAKKGKEDIFFRGKKLAYYEVLDTIKNELIARDQNLKDFGLDINLEETFL